jgi:hypothetical protein
MTSSLRVVEGWRGSCGSAAPMSDMAISLMMTIV